MNDQKARKEEKQNALLKSHLLEEDVKEMNRHRIIQMLEIESKNWFNTENLEKLSNSLLIPDFVYDETDYYLRLH